ncbi:putative phage tail protein [Escherichia coli]|uniref:putative phage tail protein n=1 Tax=Escherichia coli TaxID=562 RepID=UPI0015D10C37|nr:putative phage tail protein [Escherichia coli]
MSRFSHDDYTCALLNLLPSGMAWNRLPDSVQYRLMRGLAQAYRQSDADACALITGAFPETADALTDEWYASLGLNDECGTQASTTDPAQARKFILAKLLSTGGQSVAYFTELAATMGYSIRIREYRTPLCGFSWCGHLLSDDNRFNWTVVVAPQGDDVTTSRAYLECLFRRYAPAQTLVTFEWQSSYSAVLSMAWDNSTRLLSGALMADEGVVVSGVTVNVVIKSMSGQRYVATVTTDSEGYWSSEMDDETFADGYYTAYAQAEVDMPDDVTVPVRSTLLNVRVQTQGEGDNGDDEPASDDTTQPLVINRVMLQSGYPTQEPLIISRAHLQSGYTTQEPLIISRAHLQSGYTTKEPLIISRAHLQSGCPTQEPLVISRLWLNFAVTNE